MSAFNGLIVQDGDDNIVVQFKHGELWQHVYKLGDAVVGAGSGYVTVPGLAKFGDYWKYYSIELIDGKIEGVKVISEADYDALVGVAG